jgi:stalled ribosome rescue protein Dom34
MPPRFEAGESVRFNSPLIGDPGSAGIYNVLKVLPVERQGQQYRVKNSAEAYERVVNEIQLKKAEH